MEQRTCAFDGCNTLLVKKPGRGRWPKWCAEHKPVHASHHPSGYIAPSHRAQCSGCGKDVYRGRTSAEHPLCHECRRRRALHGTVSRYDRGCRCSKCRMVKVDSVREYQEARRSRGVPDTPPKRHYVEKTCAACGNSFQARVDNVKSGRGLYCSRRCANLTKLGLPFDSVSHRRPRLSPLHRRALRDVSRAARGTNGGNRVWIQGACAVCGEQFLSPGAASRYCSLECRHVARSGTWINYLDRMAIYDRDSWTCQICGRPLDTGCSPLSDDYPTLDHIVPRSLGGGDASSNLRCACRLCNSIRGDLSFVASDDEVRARRFDHDRSTLAA